MSQAILRLNTRDYITSNVSLNWTTVRLLSPDVISPLLPTSQNGEQKTSTNPQTTHRLTTLPVLPHSISKMTKRTKKVGVTGKYGTRYGASLRKQVKKMEVCFFFFHFSPKSIWQNVEREDHIWLIYVYTVSLLFLDNSTRQVSSPQHVTYKPRPGPKHESLSFSSEDWEEGGAEGAKGG